MQSRLALDTHQREVHRVEVDADITARLDIIESMLRDIHSQRVRKDYYSIGEVADRVGRTAYQVREWCRNGRITAIRKKCGRGRFKEWSIPHDELIRYESEGLRAVVRLPA
jgi:hypothetical protein